MKHIKLFRKAGEPTYTIPLSLCQHTRERLKLWQRLPLEDMHRELKQDIESLDRFEYLVMDDAGELQAMMVIDSDHNPHYGNYLYSRYSFSTENNLLSDGYKWMKQLCKSLSFDGLLLTRHTGTYEITSRFKPLSY